MKKKRKWSSDAGMTILEILVVLGILSLLAAVIAPRLINQFGKAKSQAAGLQISNLKSGLQLYYIDVGNYPSDTDGLSALFAKPLSAQKWSGPYLQADTALIDPWGRDYLYEISEEAPVIKSLGRDGREGGDGEDRDISG